MRYLARFRPSLNAAILEQTGGDALAWLPWDGEPTTRDKEWEGIDFLPPSVQAKLEWKTWWPQRGKSHTWDAVGRLDDRDWVLVEAKGYPMEAETSCQAEAAKSLDTIRRAFDETKRFLGVDSSADWMHRYNQTANRLAFLYLRTKHGVSARLVFLNFVGDVHPSGRWCPQSVGEWEEPLRVQREHLGLPTSHRLSDRVHTVFLPVFPLHGAPPNESCWQFRGIASR